MGVVLILGLPIPHTPATKYKQLRPLQQNHWSLHLATPVQLPTPTIHRAHSHLLQDSTPVRATVAGKVHLPALFILTFSLTRPSLPTPTVKHLKPDNMWSQTDCEILEHLAGRHRTMMFDFITERFHKLTHKVVSPQAVERKFREDGLL